MKGRPDGSGQAPGPGRVSRPWAVAGWSLALIASILGLALGWGWIRDLRPAPTPSLPALGSLLDPDVAGFATAEGDWSPVLPADHGAHPDFRGELWSVSGHLRDEDGRGHAFQLALTRLALRPGPVERPSAWATHQIYRGQLSLLPEGAGQALVAERLSRGALGLAGSAADPVRVWVRDWTLAAGDGGLELTAEGTDARLTLTLKPIKSLLGGADLDLLPRASRGQSDSSPLRLYVLPRLAASGELVLNGETLRVQGTALLDHAWGSLIPGMGGPAQGDDGPEAPGINRFGLQLADGRELLCLELRRADGSGRPIPACALILADGRVQSFRRREIDLSPVERWHSPRSGRHWPVAWDLAIEPLGLRLRLTPLAQDQEIGGALPVWSGAVSVSGEERGTAVDGRGRIDLTVPAPSAS